VRGEEARLPKLEVQYAELRGMARSGCEGEVLEEQASTEESLAGAPALAGGAGDQYGDGAEYREGSSSWSWRGVDGGTERAKQAAGDDAVYDVTGGWARAGRCLGQEDVGDRDADSERGQGEIET